jgi:hypothetical protein
MHKIMNKYEMYFQPLHMFSQKLPSSRGLSKKYKSLLLPNMQYVVSQ